jgi:hypothetical protein
MFLGHFAVGFIAKRAAPKASLGTLFAAGQLADLVWPVLVLLGVEHVRVVPGITAATPLELYDYPWSHSLVALAAWGALAGGAYWLVRRDGRGALAVAALVLSHWVLDLLMHRPDVPVLPNGPYLGLGLWNSIPVTLALELGLFAAGVAVYLRSTRAADRIGSRAFWALVAFFVVAYLAAILGPPPPSEVAVAWGANLMWLIVAWGAWVDRHRG